MTPTPDSAEAVNVRIAELCGWEWCRVGTDERPYRMLCIWNPVYTRADMSEPICNYAYMVEHGYLPNYSGSLDAMHEAEKTLTATECKRYIEELSVVSHNISRLGQAKYDAQNYAFHATAAQRAVAFLTTKTRTN